MWNVGGIPIVERNKSLVIVEILFTSLAALTVGLRLLTRAVLVKNAGLDDYLIGVALLGTIGFLVSSMHLIKFGLGRRSTGPPDPATLQRFLQSLLATVISYSFTQLVVKFSILFQYRRILIAQTAQRIFLWMIIWLTGYGLFCLLSTIITCVPVAKYWDESIPGGCIDRSKLHYVLAGFNIANDVALFVAPLPYLKNLQIPNRARYILMGVFACGGFACIVSIIRLNSLYVNNSAPISEQPIKGIDIALWSGLEINIAIICASVPALKPLFSKFFPKILSNLTGSARRSGGRSANGSLPLRSFDNRDAQTGGIEVKVQQSFEMKTIAADGDGDSEKNLVVSGNTPMWRTECYSGESSMSHRS